LLFAALTTYWDFITGDDILALHGLFCGLAALPLLLTGIAWWLILVRALALAISIGGLNLVVNKISWLPFKDFVEELFRGYILIFSLLILK